MGCTGSNSKRRARGRRVVVTVIAATLCSTLVACDSLLDVELPGQVTDDQLDNPALAATMVTSALGEFECALNELVPTNAFLTGEFVSSNFYLDSNRWGLRDAVFMKASPGACPTVRASTNYGYYVPLQRARFLAEDAARRIGGFADADVPNRADLLAQLKTYEGYSLVWLGESFCEVAIDNGPLMSPAEVLKAAEARFGEALGFAAQANDADIQNLARVGRARARLDLGDAAGAAADAALVPAGYVRNAKYSTIEIRRENSTFNRTEAAYLSVGPAWRNLTVNGAPDPRVPVADAGKMGQDGVTPQWDQKKYTARTSPIPIASWREAQLILAEARGGQAAIDAMNRVRASHGIPPLTAADVTDVTATILEERRREFFLEGQRHSDMIRHHIPFPSGLNNKGETFQDYTCMPLPDVETFNNPNIPG
ncbi:MAG TPA: RagB/SusD family nutrient uptake outer membrane protein [Longimicrobiales bacterium]|nr:RagB/SusD family nutrient uptake outer membrane protein [Longimicrobiales bacterium]